MPIAGAAAASSASRCARAAPAGCRTATLRNRRSGRTRKRALVACDDVRRTPRFTGAGMLTVLTIDLRARPAGGRRRRGDDRTPTPSTRRRPASTSPPAAAGSATTPRSTASTSPAPTRTGLPRQRPGARRPAQPVRRCRSTRACCARRPPRASSDTTSQSHVTRAAARASGRLEKIGAGRRARARESASTRCGSSAPRPTSSRSARPIHCTQWTSRIRRSRG